MLIFCRLIDINHINKNDSILALYWNSSMTDNSKLMHALSLKQEMGLEETSKIIQEEFMTPHGKVIHPESRLAYLLDAMAVSVKLSSLDKEAIILDNNISTTSNVPKLTQIASDTIPDFNNYVYPSIATITLDIPMKAIVDTPGNVFKINKNENPIQLNGTKHYIENDILISKSPDGDFINVNYGTISPIFVNAVFEERYDLYLNDIKYDIITNHNDEKFLRLSNVRIYQYTMEEFSFTIEEAISISNQGNFSKGINKNNGGVSSIIGQYTTDDMSYDEIDVLYSDNPQIKNGVKKYKFVNYRMDEKDLISFYFASRVGMFIPTIGNKFYLYIYQSLGAVKISDIHTDTSFLSVRINNIGCLISNIQVLYEGVDMLDAVGLRNTIIEYKTNNNEKLIGTDPELFGMFKKYLKNRKDVDLTLYRTREDIISSYNVALTMYGLNSKEIIPSNTIHVEIPLMDIKNQGGVITPYDTFYFDETHNKYVLLRKDDPKSYYNKNPKLCSGYFYSTPFNLSHYDINGTPFLFVSNNYVNKSYTLRNRKIFYNTNLMLLNTLHINRSYGDNFYKIRVPLIVDSSRGSVDSIVRLNIYSIDNKLLGYEDTRINSSNQTSAEFSIKTNDVISRYGLSIYLHTDDKIETQQLVDIPEEVLIKIEIFSSNTSDPNTSNYIVVDNKRFTRSVSFEISQKVTLFENLNHLIQLNPHMGGDEHNKYCLCFSLPVINNFYLSSVNNFEYIMETISKTYGVCKKLSNRLLDSVYFNIIFINSFGPSNPKLSNLGSTDISLEIDILSDSQTADMYQNYYDNIKSYLDSINTEGEIFISNLTSHITKLQHVVSVHIRSINGRNVSDYDNVLFNKTIGLSDKYSIDETTIPEKVNVGKTLINKYGSVSFTNNLKLNINYKTL